jgi:galactose mutarotase-like enzyme
MPVGCTTPAEKENVFISAGDCSLAIVPDLGGKIASICIKGQELLQAPLAPLAPRTHEMSFDAADASGWDECLPTVGDCTVDTAAGPKNIPDHGDLWRVRWEILSAGDHSIESRVQCFSLPITLHRTVALSEVKSGFQIQLAYKLTNTGRFTVPWSWAAHPLFAADAGDRIELPDSIRSLRVEGSAGNRLGANGDIVDWPVTTLKSGMECDLSVAQPPSSAIGDKLFAGPLASTENWCALLRPRAGVCIRFRFDPVETPYLGLWLCYGGWPDRSGPKQMCVALEPCTAPVDSLAKTGPWTRMLDPGQSCSWSLNVDLEAI